MRDEVRIAAPTTESVRMSAPQVLLTCGALVSIALYIVWSMRPHGRLRGRPPKPLASPPSREHRLDGEYATCWGHRAPFLHDTLHAWCSFDPADASRGFMDMTVRGSVTVDCADAPYTIDAQGRIVPQSPCLNDAVLSYDSSDNTVSVAGTLRGKSFLATLKHL